MRNSATGTLIRSSAMSTRARILEVAARLVAESPNGDVSTRAVCDAAQVGAPALYRYFGDKEGLLSAVVDYGFDRYLETKRQRAPENDPIEDLRKGWDSHVEFALDNPNLYRLMYSPRCVRLPLRRWSPTRSSPGTCGGRRRTASCGWRRRRRRRSSCRPMSGWR